MNNIIFYAKKKDTYNLRKNCDNTHTVISKIKYFCRPTSKINVDDT